MKNCLFILLLFIWHPGFSQLNDNFLDGNFSANPIWEGDTGAFSVNASNQLQSNFFSEGAIINLATQSHLAFWSSWEFFIRLDFDPSPGNRLRIYLISDNRNLKDSLQGYFIQIGESGAVDSYDLYRQTGNTVVKIFDGPDQVRVSPDQLICRLKITRTQEGLWQLSSDKTGGNNFQPDGSVSDDTFMQSAWFGAVCQFTATRSGKFYFDDFKIESWQDNLPPAVEAKLNDIVINEFLADPEPAVKLPAAEFIELWNRTAKFIALKNWVYSDASSNYKFGTEGINPDEHLIVCAKADTDQFKSFGRVISISPWPSLNNSADHLSLKDPKGRLINELTYTDSWYQDGDKKDGGWTLELIDAEAICGGLKNWKASVDTKGGTPGSRNSIYQIYSHSEPLRIEKLWVLDSISIAVTYNRFTDSTSATDLRNYSLNNGAKLQSAVYLAADPLTVILKCPVPLTRGNVYKLVVNQVSDCAGTLISSPFNSADLSLPAEIKEGDILISEILFNPGAGGVDFVELYNHSSHAVDLHELTIGNQPLPDTLNRSKAVSSNPFMLKAGDYITLTADPEKVKSNYFTENPNAFIKVSGFPAFNNDQGIVSILRNNKPVDQFTYTEKMHSPIIKDPDGISLERSDFAKPANDPGNFKSAAAAKGFATPGYKNSQFLEDAGTKDAFNVLSSTFSPDDDGFEDRMQINYLLSKPDFIANIIVYDSSGHLVRKLYSNYTLGTQGSIEWDGRNDTAEIPPTGIYLVYAELFTTSGELKKFRKTVVLASKYR
jgi:hypothetical protein